MSAQGDSPDGPYGHYQGPSPYQSAGGSRGGGGFGIACIIVGTVTFLLGLVSAWSTSQMLRRVGMPADIGLMLLGWLLPALVQLMLVIAGIMLVRRR